MIGRRFKSGIRLAWLLLWNVCPVLGVWSQIQWQTDALIQRLPDGQAYLEVQTGWESDVFTPSDRFTLTVMASRGGEILTFAKSTLPLRPATTDSVALSHVHVDRLAVPDGPCTVEWSITGIPDVFERVEEFRVPLGGMPEFSDPILVSTHGAASEISDPNLVHSGLDILPAIGRVIPSDVQAATWYFELHNMADIVGMDSLFLLVMGWSDADGNWTPESTKFKRLRAKHVVPVLDQLPCSPLLPTPASPTLKLEARTRDGHIIVSRDIILPNRHGHQLADQDGYIGTHGALDVLPSLRGFGDPDRAVVHLLDHLPLATTNEQTTMQMSLAPQENPDRIQQYLTSFWLERGGGMAEAEAMHVQYMERIALVNSEYGACKQGVGSMTEMGNIYLRFGRPNTVVKRHHETDYYPYEIWHYHKAGRFNNKRFLFYSPHVVSECFELLHSDMLGERQNEDWLSQLRSRENRLRVSESMENRLNPRDAFSREEPEDLFYNPR
ncbi:MAG: GWxTD domain-containing protein [Bacteroidetes bacterium]|nr:GWxTD domain-containing protein [Bacteroidota bacterium]MDA0902748.1 GWxTD domain-containing protein [Bacteroidota bacterium]MDA1242885.1 GWxTD domain-containing protein [Bacteroidota bacterium]